MAKVTADKTIKGTRAGITFYEMNGTNYARSKSSLTGKRVKKDPAFERTMALAEIFAYANKIVSDVYSQLPAKEKGRDVRYSMIRRARKMVDEGMTKEEIIAAITPVTNRVDAGAQLLREILGHTKAKTRMRFTEDLFTV